jgi:hypothetical protein
VSDLRVLARTRSLYGAEDQLTSRCSYEEIDCCDAHPTSAVGTGGRFGHVRCAPESGDKIRADASAATGTTAGAGTTCGTISYAPYSYRSTPCLATRSPGQPWGGSRGTEQTISTRPRRKADMLIDLSNVAFGGKADINGRHPMSAFDPKRSLAGPKSRTAASP